MTNGHDVGGLGAYALGVLIDDDRRVLENHLAGCEECRHELAQLERAAAELDRVPPEMFMDGPPEDAELVLQRTLLTARKEESRHTTSRRAWRAAAVAAAVVTAAVGGVALGMVQGRDATVVSPPPIGSATAAQPSGVRTGSYTDPTTKAGMAVSLVPAVGWVRVNATVTGIPAGQRCRIWVVARDGTRQQAGSWLVSEKGAREGTTLDGSAIVAPGDVAAVEVDNFSGETFVTVAV